MRDPGDGPARAPDDLAESLAEEFLLGATGSEDAEDEAQRSVAEEIGGPFVITKAADEFADDVDASNPEGATVEPLPRANGGPVVVIVPTR